MSEGFSRAEAIELLQDIAKNAKNSAARIAAIKELRAMDELAPDEAGDEIYGDELAVRRSGRGREG